MQVHTMLEEARVLRRLPVPGWPLQYTYVHKKTGDIRICVDYRELNKRTTKDAYPYHFQMRYKTIGRLHSVLLYTQRTKWLLTILPDD